MSKTYSTILFGSEALTRRNLLRGFLASAGFGALGYLANLRPINIELSQLSLLIYLGPIFPLLVSITRGPALGALAMVIAMSKTVFAFGHIVVVSEDAVWAFLTGLFISKYRPILAVLLGFFPIAFPITHYAGYLIVGYPLPAISKIAYECSIPIAVTMGFLAEALLLSPFASILYKLKQ